MSGFGFGSLFETHLLHPPGAGIAPAFCTRLHSITSSQCWRQALALRKSRRQRSVFEAPGLDIASSDG